MSDITRCKFPRAVEENPCAQAVREMFRAALPIVHLDAAITATLQRALRTGRLKRGLETTLDVLNNERRGLAKLQNKTGTPQEARVSRIILISSDASGRLRREIGNAVRRNAPRVLAMGLQADSATLGSLLYGADALVKVLLLDHKDTAADMLIAAAQQEGNEQGSKFHVPG